VLVRTTCHFGPLVSLLICCGLLSAAVDDPAGNNADQRKLLGRWDVTVHGKDGKYPSWFEFRLSGYRTLVGSYVGQFGSARPIANVEYHRGVMRFLVPPQWERRSKDVVFEGEWVGDELRGQTTDDKGEVIRWEARRAPDLKRDGEPSWAEAQPLFNGRDLEGWHARNPAVRNGWTVEDGKLVNRQPGNDLVSERRFGDFKLHAEFRIPKGSNSGIYLRGRYEVQIEDNFGREPDSHEVGGVYGFLTPTDNPSRAPGEWQSYDITLVGRRVTVVLNGTTIIHRQIIPGITGGALDGDEGAAGPIMIQGDHGPIEFRSLTITPAIERP